MRFLSRAAHLHLTIAKVPLVLAVIVVAVGGAALLSRSDAQARDTIRKHHLDDIEQALYFAFNTQGTFPPYDETSWCGELGIPDSADVTAAVEAVLRQQHEKYANPDKPFPHDPLEDRVPRAMPARSLWRRGAALAKWGRAGEHPRYFYWKHSPATFELLTQLEADTNADRLTEWCDTDPNHQYNYSILSTDRQYATKTP